MFKAIRALGSSVIQDITKPFNLNKQSSGYFSSWMSFYQRPLDSCPANFSSTQNSLSTSMLQATSNNLCLSRNVTKFSLKTGKKKSVNGVLLRFFRLNNGLWIRRRAGCHKRIHKRSTKDKYNFQQHVVCTKTQCIMFDKMITDFHKKKTYYIDDPFEPYHVRNNLDWVLPVRKR